MASKDNPYPSFLKVGLDDKLLKKAVDDEATRIAIHRPEFELSNEFVLDLVSLQNELGYAWPVVKLWIASICGVQASSMNLKATVSKIQRLKDKRAKYLNDKDRVGLDCLLSQCFAVTFFDADLNASLPSTPSISSPTPSVISTDDAACTGNTGDEVFSLADQDISVAGEREQLNPQATKASFDKLYGKLRNLKKIVKQRDTEIQQRRASERKSSEDVENLQEEFENLQEDFESLETELRAIHRKLTSEHQRVYYHRRESDGAGLDTTAKDEICSLKAEVSTCRKRIAELEASLDDAECQLAGGGFFDIKVGGQYRDEDRKCCYDILVRNLGVWNVRPVITSVLEMVGLEVRDLPSIGSLSEMLVELKHISQLHVADELQGEVAATLQSDGTSKFGRKYGSCQISTKDRTFFLGIVEMKCGTAEHTVDVLKALLSDVDDSCKSVGEEGTGRRILLSLKNTMSNLSIVQKKCSVGVLSGNYASRNCC